MSNLTVNINGNALMRVRNSVTGAASHRQVLTWLYNSLAGTCKQGYRSF